MRILIVHNDYAAPSGEEAVVDRMKEIFGSLGHEVSRLRMTTAGMREIIAGKAKGFVAGLYSPAGVKAMREAIAKDKPDLINVHNLYPFISPAALRECKKAGVPVIMTVHNYRLICPTGLFMRNNAPCEECLEKGNEWGCVKYNCEHSILKSAGYAARNALARVRRHYQDCVDRFACLTEFQRSKLIEAGFPAEKLTVIPNCVDISETDYSSISEAGNYVGYSGRISSEKGVDMLIEIARRHPEIEFRAAGAVRDPAIVSNLPENFKLTGFLKGKELENFYRNAAFFVMPSRWYEGFPMTIPETARYGKPMIGPFHGGFPEIIGSTGDSESGGLLFNPGDIRDLETKIISLWQNKELSMKMGLTAKNKTFENYSTQAVTKRWKKEIETLSDSPFHPIQ